MPKLKKKPNSVSTTPPNANRHAQSGQESDNEVDEQDGAAQEFVSKNHLAEMLKVQESMFRSLFDSMLGNVTSRIDGIVSTLSDLKSSLEFTQGEVDNLKSVKAKAKVIEEELGHVQDQIDFHSGKMEYLENQSRRNNIRIDGIPEDANESWIETETKAIEALSSHLKLPFQVKIERAHRTGKRRNAQPSRPRTIVCRLANWKEKEPILRAARKVKPSGFFVNEDLAAETIQRRKDQMPKLKQAKQAGKIAYFVLDRLIIKDRQEA